jgi:hypothetical protein
MDRVKVISNKYIFNIFKNAVALAFNPYIIVKNDLLLANKSLLRHEYVHILQQRELGLIKFIYLYFKYFLTNYLKYKDKSLAYYKIPFEIEAFLSQDDKNLANSRKYHWSRYVP